MREDIAGPQGASSRPTWECLEALVREKAQERVQRILEEQVTELLGREKRNLSTTMGHSTGLIKEQFPVWRGVWWED